LNEFFKYENLKKFLVLLRDNYPIMSFRDCRSNGVLLRHDIDFSIEKAYRMALVEKMCGVKSTYFVMMSSYTYNPFAEENRRMLRKIILLGFEIGLHFDPAIYDDVNNLRNAVDTEAKALEFIGGKEIKAISLHNLGVLKRSILFEGYINASDKSILSDEVYLSDSCMDFRGKDPYEFVKKANDIVIQILLHPCFYNRS